jgi:hypothetical protein
MSAQRSGLGFVSVADMLRVWGSFFFRCRPLARSAVLEGLLAAWGAAKGLIGASAALKRGGWGGSPPKNELISIILCIFYIIPPNTTSLPSNQIIKQTNKERKKET